MERFVCVHGHFYQPPRENPWLEAIELQDSAYPYHDWNARITAECYAPNAHSRILDDDGRIAAIVNNYARISFNVGPTLLAWMEWRAPDVYEAVLAADRESVERFSGHGNALAQAYNHMILPLASPRDRETQVRWGVRDFEARFGRPPEGMWLPETAVDLASLGALAAEGVRFTVLAPSQAGRVRARGARKWNEGEVDTTVPYLVRLGGGRTITVFFYDGPLSQAVAFERLLADGAHLADRLMGAFPDVEDGAPRLAHIATDGETYGHHHRHGDMALAYALQRIEDSPDAELTNYGEFLERRPPEAEVQVVENTSWSCAHGVERWRSDCGCDTGRGWSQAWRRPVRESLDWLRGRLEPLFEERAGELLAEPWAARDDYVEVVLDRSRERVDKFLDRHSSHSLDDDERTRALELLEMQRHAMLMFTSCGWFFDELSGIETVQVLQYAGRAIQLAEKAGAGGVEREFLDRLDEARSNLPEHGAGRRVYERSVRPAMVDLPKVAAHWAATTLFEEEAGAPGAEAEQVYCYDVEREDVRVLDAGPARLVVGRVRVTSQITRQGSEVGIGAVHLGDHNLNVGARPSLDADAYRAMATDLTEAFEQADLPEVVRRLGRHFGDHPFSLRTLFRDEQRRLLERILGSSLRESAEAQQRLHERQVALIRFLAGIGVPLPRPFKATAQLVVDEGLREQFASLDCDPDVVSDLLGDTADWGLELDVAGHAFTLANTVLEVARRLRERPTRQRLAEQLENLVAMARSLPWPVDLWETQNTFYDVLQQPGARADRDRFRRIAAQLAIRVPEDFDGA